jgi:hypothetical protein
MAIRGQKRRHPDIRVEQAPDYALCLRSERVSSNAAATSSSISDSDTPLVRARIRSACASHHEPKAVRSSTVRSTSALSGSSTAPTGRKTPPLKTARIRPGIVIAKLWHHETIAQSRELRQAIFQPRQKTVAEAPPATGGAAELPSPGPSGASNSEQTRRSSS